MASVDAKNVGVVAKLRELPITTTLYWDFIDGVIKNGDRTELLDLLVEANRVISELSGFLPKVKDKKIYFKSKQPSEDKARINQSLRFFILRRDNHHCKLCGQGVEDGIKLHVDHIKPFSKGGKTREDNLRTLCGPCNIGRKNNYED